MNTILLKNEYDFITDKLSSNDLLEERAKSLDPILELIDYWESQKLIKEMNRFAANIIEKEVGGF